MYVCVLCLYTIYIIYQIRCTSIKHIESINCAYDVLDFLWPIAHTHRHGRVVYDLAKWHRLINTIMKPFTLTDCNRNCWYTYILKRVFDALHCGSESETPVHRQTVENLRHTAISGSSVFICYGHECMNGANGEDRSDNYNNTSWSIHSDKFEYCSL